MILRNATIQYSGVDPEDLKSKSRKRVCCSCDNPNCKNPIRWCRRDSYRDLCRSCARKGKYIGKNSPHWKNRIILICQYCNKEFKIKESLKNTKFCSKKCQGKWQSKNLIGENAPNYKGGLVTKICIICGNKFESTSSANKKLCSEKCFGKYQTKENNSQWKGGISNLDQPHLTPINQCIKLNERFKNSEGHHLNKNIVIFIPVELHKYIDHDMKTGKGIYEINTLALQYLNGEYKESNDSI